MEPSNDVGGSRDDQSAAETVRIVRGKQGVGWVDFWAMSDVGMVRPNNEDQYLTCRLGKSLQVLQSSIAEGEGMALAEPEAYLMLVADGIGGAAGGERASAVVVEEAKLYVLETAKWFFSLDDPGEEIRIRQLREALDRIDRRLNDEAGADPALAGMGTTLTRARQVDGH